jgi:hypothetical protein
MFLSVNRTQLAGTRANVVDDMPLRNAEIAAVTATYFAGSFVDRRATRGWQARRHAAAAAASSWWAST